MKLNKQRLMEMAGLNEEANNPYKKHKGYIAVYRVMGQDFTVGPLKTNDKQEVLDMLGNAIMGGFRLMDIVPADQFKGVEKYGGLMLEDRVDEIQLGITNPNDEEAMKNVKKADELKFLKDAGDTKVKKKKAAGMDTDFKNVKKTNKKKDGGFPDLTGDNKVTKVDILKGRGVPGFSRGGGIAIQGLGFKGVR